VRTIQTFILRLLVDSAKPEVLRGTLQPLPEGESRPFVSDQALLALLRQMALTAREAPDSETAAPVNVRREKGGES
jgi:hypothetical protein